MQGGRGHTPTRLRKIRQTRLTSFENVEGLQLNSIKCLTKNYQMSDEAQKVFVYPAPTELGITRFQTFLAELVLNPDCAVVDNANDVYSCFALHTSWYELCYDTMCARLLTVIHICDNLSVIT